MDRLRLPRTGERLSVFGRHGRVRLAGRVLGEDPEGLLSLELEADSPVPRRGRRVELEWIHGLGLARATARIEAARSDLVPTLQVALTEAPRLVERRERMRTVADLPVLAWSLAGPTRLFTGRTVNLGGSGALVRLPGLPPAATLLDLRIDLDRPLMTTARIVRREEPDLVAVAFEAIKPDDHERLIHYVLAGLREQATPAGGRRSSAVSTDWSDAHSLHRPNGRRSMFERLSRRLGANPPSAHRAAAPRSEIFEQTGRKEAAPAGAPDDIPRPSAGAAD